MTPHLASLAHVLPVALALCAPFALYALLTWRARRAYRVRSAARARLPTATPLPDGRLRVRNPIVTTGQDPWIAHVPHDAVAPYHYVHTEEVGLLHVARAPDIFAFDTVAPYYTWDPKADPATAHLQMLWAPELHCVRGRWVIYVAANATSSLLKGTHRMYVLAARDDGDLSKGFAFWGQLPLPGDRWAIDGTPFRHAGKLYHVWSGWAAGRRLHQQLYICEMQDAFRPVAGAQAIQISRPTYPWELRGRRLGLWPSINEGPVELHRGERSYLVYSASGSWSDHYCLGLLEFTGHDPLDPAAWTKHPEPVLASSREVIAPGHCGFLQRGGELLLLYHAAKYPRAGWDREVHVGKMDFTDDDWPVFPSPQRDVAL